MRNRSEIVFVVALALIAAATAFDMGIVVSMSIFKAQGTFVPAHWEERVVKTEWLDDQSDRVFYSEPEWVPAHWVLHKEW